MELNPERRITINFELETQKFHFLVEEDQYFLPDKLMVYLFMKSTTHEEIVR